MPDQKCTKHAITFQDSIGLTITYDPLISEKVANFEFYKFEQKEKQIPDNRGKFGKGEYHSPWKYIFSVK